MLYQITIIRKYNEVELKEKNECNYCTDVWYGFDFIYWMNGNDWNCYRFFQCQILKWIKFSHCIIYFQDLGIQKFALSLMWLLLILDTFKILKWRKTFDVYLDMPGKIGFLFGYFIMKFKFTIKWVVETDYKVMIYWGNPLQ